MKNLTARSDSALSDLLIG